MNRGDIKLVIDRLNGIQEPLHQDDFIVLELAVSMLETLGNKVEEQAAVIEKLKNAASVAMRVLDPLHGNVYKIVHEAMWLQTDSKQILKDWLGELGDKVTVLGRNLAEEQRDYKAVEATLHSERDASQSLREKVAEQAVVIAKLRDVIWDTNKFIDQTYADLIGSNSSEALAARYADALSNNLSNALAIPTDSKQILKDWMREQLGEAVAVETYKGYLLHADDPRVAEHSDPEPLFKLPECLK